MKIIEEYPEEMELTDDIIKAFVEKLKSMEGVGHVEVDGRTILSNWLDDECLIEIQGAFFFKPSIWRHEEGYSISINPPMDEVMHGKWKKVC